MFRRFRTLSPAVFDRRRSTSFEKSTLADKIYKFLTAVSRSDTDGVRAWMLALLTSHASPLFVSFLSTVTVATTAMKLTGRTWPIAWIVTDFALTAFRLRTLYALKSGEASSLRRERRHLLLILAGLAWAALYGLGAGGLIANGHPVLMVLGGINIAGAIGTISMRLAGAPRFGLLAMVLCFVPAEVGFIVTPTQNTEIIPIIFPLLFISFSFILYQNSKFFLRLFHAERALSDLAGSDLLTGLANRKSLDETLEDLCSGQDSRGTTVLTVLFLDLDEFKSVNDSLGHAVGDKLLKHVAERLNHATRAGDRAFRLGGDEFVCTLPGADAHDAGIIAQRLIDSISQPVDLGGDQVVQVGVSIGGATIRLGACSAPTLLSHADAALYAAKKAGKNQYFSHSTR